MPAETEADTFAPLDAEAMQAWLVDFVRLVGSLNAVAGNPDRREYIACRRGLTTLAHRVAGAMLASRRPA